MVGLLVDTLGKRVGKTVGLGEGWEVMHGVGSNVGVPKIEKTNLLFAHDQYHDWDYHGLSKQNVGIRF